jgi:hypothetical protein
MATMTQAAPGMRVKKTTFTEVLPAEASPTDAQPSKFYSDTWENVVNKLTQAQWSEHLVRVYRAGEKWEQGAAPVDNVFTGPFSEEDIRARFGGGKFILWMLGPPKKHTLVAKWQVELEGAPIINSVPRNGQAAGTESVAIEAMRLYANPQFMQLQMDVMRSSMLTALEMVKGQMPSQQNPLETLRAAKEILGGGNGDHSLLDTIRVLKEIGVIGSPEKKGIDEILGLITTLKTSGLIPSGAPKADLAATFANNLPMLVDRVVNGLHEFRLTSEANERAVRLNRGEIKPGDPNVIDVNPTPPNSPATQAAPSTTGAAPTPAVSGANPSQTSITPEVAQTIIAQSHLHRLVMGIKNPKSTGQDMYDYLVNAWPEILDELAKMSKETLLAFFKNREAQIQYFGADTLAEVGDDPRLPKMIEDFLRIAKENAALETAATSTAGIV